MSAIVFRNSERSYLKWLSDHPEGYVLTTSSSAPVQYMSLHRATCRMISAYMSNMTQGAFTERGYIKVCSSDTEPLRAWISLKGGRDFTTLCSKCHPTVPPSTAILSHYADFELDVSRACKDTAARRQARLEKAVRRPTFTLVSTMVFKRNPDVVAEVLERATGVCESCGENAPFQRRADGSPYLEVHHLVRLADGGEDSTENAIAICPNCHRKMHFGQVNG